MLLIGRVGADVDRSFLVRWWPERTLERKWLRIGTPCVRKQVQMAAERMGGVLCMCSRVRMHVCLLVLWRCVCVVGFARVSECKFACWSCGDVFALLDLLACLNASLFVGLGVMCFLVSVLCFLYNSLFLMLWEGRWECSIATNIN